MPLNKSHQGGYCSFQGLLVCLVYLLFKASLKVESSSFSSTFVAKIDFACWSGVTLLGGSDYGPGR